MRVTCLLVSMAAGFAVSGCVGELPPGGVALLEQVKSRYDQGEFRQAIAKADEFIALHGRTEPAGEAYYLRGLAYLAVKDRKRARENFEQAIAAAHRSDLIPLARVALGNLAFEDGQFAHAAGQYSPIIDQLPNESPKDQVLFRLGQCCVRLGNWRDGKAWFSQLAALFPASRWEPHARSYLACDAFSVQCGAYLDKDKADAKVALLKEHDFKSARWVQDPRMKYHLVQVGSYRTHQEARAELARLLPITEAIIVP